MADSTDGREFGILINTESDQRTSLQRQPDYQTWPSGWLDYPFETVELKPPKNGQVRSDQDD